ncbi:MAG: NAD(P)H-dependent oxidoreductase subunit E [Deltaproteobacteria bacterium]|nr:NAD(P)H-dependent oxidoreductase subunit E [Deltaproteobacteria bacterium]
MKKLKNILDFHSWNERLKSDSDLSKPTIMICGGTGCTALGSQEVYKSFEKEIVDMGLSSSVNLKKTGCHGFCEKGPVVLILPERFFYPGVQPEDVKEILQQTVVEGKVIDRLLYVDPVSGQKITYEHDVPFYALQQRNVFRNNGKVDPVDIEDYILNDGYIAFVKVLKD